MWHAPMTAYHILQHKFTNKYMNPNVFCKLHDSFSYMDQSQKEHCANAGKFHLVPCEISCRGERIIVSAFDFLLTSSATCNQLRLITLPETLIIPDITKTSSNYCFIIHCFMENNTLITLAETFIILDYSLIITLAETLIIPDYSLIIPDKWINWRWVRRLRPVLFLKYSNNFKEKEILLFYGFLGLNCNLL